MAHSRMDERRGDPGLRAAYGLAIAIVVAAAVSALRVLAAQYWQ